jgi:hypothetical protein
MNPWLRRALGALVAIGATFALVALSRVPYAIESSDDALIRLSWRTATAFVEECRTPTAGELERLPIHMRREQICDGRLLPYRLHVEHDGVVVLDEWVRGAGARRDRPLSVLHELRVRPGTHHVHVRWLPDSVHAAVPRAADAATRATPPALELVTRLSLQPHEVALITYDGTLRRLVVRTSAAP